MGSPTRMIASSIVGALAVSSPVAAKELRYGTPVAAVSDIVKEAVKTFDRITKATNGTLTFKVFPNGEVVNTRTVLKGIGSGIVDMGHVVWVLQPTELPHASMAAQALAFADSPLAAAGAVAEFFMVTCKECRAEYRKANAMPLGAESGSRYVLMCAKEVDSVDDLKGLRVRAVGGMARWANQLGMIPTRIASPEILQSMQRGVVQCALGLLPWLRFYSLKDATKVIYDTRKGAALGGGAFWINVRTWRGLSPAHRKAIVDALPDAMYRLTEVAYGVIAEEERKKAIDAGIKVTDGGEAYAAKWQAFRANERKALVALAAKRKIEDPEAFVTAMIGLFETWNRLMNGKEKDKAHFESLVRSRVVGKSPLLRTGAK